MRYNQNTVRPLPQNGSGISSFINKYLAFDARQIANHLPKAKFVDVTITSPPYWNLKDYGHKSQIGFGQPYSKCLDDLESVFGQVYLITKESGSLWIIADTIKAEGELKPFPFDLASRLRNVGWILQDIIIWHKDKTLPWSHRGKLRNIFEYILFFTKGKHFQYELDGVREIDGLKEWWIHYPERYNPQGKAPTRTWSIPIPRQGSWGDNWVRHFCPLPPELVRRIILMTTDANDVVMDPFSGSGVVLAQASAMQRRYIGIDISNKQYSMFQHKVLPSITKLEKSNQQRRACLSKAAFEKTIWELRKLKYPKELQKLFEKQHHLLPLKFTLVRSSQQTQIELVMIFESMPSQTVLKNLYRITDSPPLSKYGLDVQLRVCTLKQKASVLLANKEKLHIFLNGNTTLPAKQKLRDLGSLHRNGDRYSPIVSTINPHLWLELKNQQLA